jgi:hypothetical protein
MLFGLPSCFCCYLVRARMQDKFSFQSMKTHLAAILAGMAREKND